MAQGRFCLTRPVSPLVDGHYAIAWPIGLRQFVKTRHCQIARQGQVRKLLTQTRRLHRWRCSVVRHFSFGEWLCGNVGYDDGARSKNGAQVRLFLELDCGDEWLHAHDGDHALEIVGKNTQAHLCSNVFETFHQEVRRAHPGLDGAKGMLDRSSSDVHCVWCIVQTLEQRINDALMLPAPYPSFLGRCAFAL